MSHPRFEEPVPPWKPLCFCAILAFFLLVFVGAGVAFMVLLAGLGLAAFFSVANYLGNFERDSKEEKAAINTIAIAVGAVFVLVSCLIIGYSRN